MRRNNLFMWAYISFVFISVVVRLLVDYSLWAPLVIAITISSIPFGIEDLFISLSKSLNDSCDIKENFTSIFRRRAEKELCFFENVSQRKEFFKNEMYDISSLQETWEHSKDRLSGMIQRIAYVENASKVERERQKRYEKTANVFSYLGFLSLFCSLIFTSLITIPTHIQEVFTVFSFGIILMTHQINVDISTKIKDDSIKFQDILQDQDQVEDGLSSAENCFNILTEFIEDYANSPEEELDHAN
ncbi:MAG: hypothetical protein HDT14_06440 [Oscillibacter sp.]|nr:hypothetical protein [Oscillibacter sp.]